MSSYNIKWEIEIEAETPVEAAKQSQQWMEEGIKWVFTVTNTNTKEKFLVDMGDENPKAKLY